MNAEIRINVVIKATPEKIYKAITTKEGIESWWCKNTIAKPALGFMNIFVFGKFRNEMKVTKLTTDKKVEWECVDSIEEWVGTHISFDLEEKEEGKTLLRFTQAGWRAVTDTYAGCTYDWASFMKSLKSFSETGAGTPS
jgi:uncharacterized protein YndB with AHSA1/START domain